MTGPVPASFVEVLHGPEVAAGFDQLRTELTDSMDAALACRASEA
jgi:hypothetical protein